MSKVGVWSRRPGELELLRSIAQRWKGESADFEALVRLNANFSKLPYENVSKILKAARVGAGEDPRRLPAEVFAEHVKFGFGGTCFSLTAFMEDLLRLSGFEPMRMLADTPAGPARHSAVLVPIGNRLFLVDPGYLVGEPLPIPDRAGASVRSGELELVRIDQTTAALYTVLPNGARKLRYSFRIFAAPQDEFVQRWLESFEWPTSRSLLITKREGGKIVYVHDFHFRIVSAGEAVQKQNLRGKVGLVAREVFGLPPEAVERALEIARARKRALKQMRRHAENSQRH